MISMKKTLGTLMLSSTMLLVPALALANTPAPGSAPSAPAKDGSSAKKKHHDKKADQKKDDSKKN
jgi:Spy/CpxP family protein refolding chaperone